MPVEGSGRAHVAHLTPDTLRHTFGTRWPQAGGDIFKLSRIQGRSIVAVTEAHYAHLLKDDLVAADGLDGTLTIGVIRAVCSYPARLGQVGGAKMVYTKGIYQEEAR